MNADRNITRIILLCFFGLALMLLPASNAFCAGCSITTVLTDSGGGAVSDLSDRPARICSVEFLATAAGGFAQCVDSPDDTDSHAQARNVCEPGAASSGDWVSGWFGEDGKETIHGLELIVENGTLVIEWSTR